VVGGWEFVVPFRGETALAGWPVVKDRARGEGAVRSGGFFGIRGG